MRFLVLVQVQVRVLDLSGPTSFWFGLGTFLGPDLVHVQHLLCCFSLCHVNHTSHQLLKKKVTDFTASIR